MLAVGGRVVGMPLCRRGVGVARGDGGAAVEGRLEGNVEIGFAEAVIGWG